MSEDMSGNTVYDWDEVLQILIGIDWLLDNNGEAEARANLTDLIEVIGAEQQREAERRRFAPTPPNGQPF